MANTNQKTQAQDKSSASRTTGSEKGSSMSNMGNKRSERPDRSDKRFNDDESGAV